MVRASAFLPTGQSMKATGKMISFQVWEFVYTLTQQFITGNGPTDRDMDTVYTCYLTRQSLMVTGNTMSSRTLMKA